MDVTIKESKFSFRSTYVISSPQGDFKAVKKLWSLFTRISITPASNLLGDGPSQASIRGTSVFRARYEFVIPGIATYQFRRTSAWKQVYSCEGDGHQYEFFEHRKRRYSIFQDGQQIAAISRNLIVIGSGYEYDIQMNSDANLLLVACMVIAVNTTDASNDDGQQVVNIDFGNVGLQGRVFDETWQPR